MKKDTSKMRHQAAPPPQTKSASPPGGLQARRLLPTLSAKWLRLAFCIALALALSSTFSAQLSTSKAFAQTAETTQAVTPGAPDIASEVDESNANELPRAIDETVPEGDAVPEDAPAEGRITEGSGLSSRGGTRPVQSTGSRLAAIAVQYEGAPYRWAGASPSGFDCSGFTMYVYGQAGISIPRNHHGQLNSGKQVGIDELEPGDIVFFANTYARGLSHSGIYLGNNNFIHAETERTGVVISQLRGSQWEWDFVGGSRPYEQ